MASTARNLHSEESAEVEVLMANMEKLETLTKKISISLGSLNTSGSSVKASIRPIQGNTGRLQSANGNIIAIRAAIEKVRTELLERRAEEPIIRAGIGAVGIGTYAAAMERTSRTLSSMRSNSSKSNEPARGELEGLLGDGNREMEGLFASRLKAESVEVEPLHYIHKGVPFPAIEPETSQTLRAINTHMTSTTAGEPQTQRLYAEIRGAYISKTLHNLASASVKPPRKLDPNVIYRQGTSGIGSYCKALEALLDIEWDNVCSIFEREQWPAVHKLACGGATREFAQTLSQLHDHVQNHLLTDCFLAFEVIDIVQGLSIRIGAHNPDVRPEIDEALRPMKTLGREALKRLIDDIKASIQSMPNLPPDGATLPQTHEAMTRLIAMTDYLIPLASLLPSRKDGTLELGFDTEALFSEYMAETIRALLGTLEYKTQNSAKNKGSNAIIMANNVAVIERSMTSPQFSLIPMDKPRETLALFRRKGIKGYSETWDPLVRNLQDQVHTGRAAGTRPGSGGDSSAFVKSLSSKEREGIKERFRNFNQLFDELMARHRTYRLEPEVRAEISRDISALVQTYYDRFWDRYHDIDKGKGKHAKFDKAGLNAALMSL